MQTNQQHLVGVGTGQFFRSGPSQFVGEASIGLRVFGFLVRCYVCSNHAIKVTKSAHLLDLLTRQTEK